jgi:hypothetical protein
MRIRLLTRTQHPDGHWIERGEVTDWPDDVKPPYRLQQKSADLIDYDPANGLDANHTSGNITDVPLFEEVKEDHHG